MRAIATRDAGYSPVLRDTIIAGRRYDLPDTAELPDFLEPADGQEESAPVPEPAPEPEAPHPWDNPTPEEEDHGGIE